MASAPVAGHLQLHHADGQAALGRSSASKPLMLCLISSWMGRATSTPRSAVLLRGGKAAPQQHLAGQGPHHAGRLFADVQRILASWRDHYRDQPHQAEHGNQERHGHHQKCPCPHTGWDRHRRPLKAGASAIPSCLTPRERLMVSSKQTFPNRAKAETAPAPSGAVGICGDDQPPCSHRLTGPSWLAFLPQERGKHDLTSLGRASGRIRTKTVRVVSP